MIWKGNWINMAFKRWKDLSKDEKESRKIFEKILSENKLNKGVPKFEDKMVTFKITEKKAQNILKEGGMMDAYEYLISQLCKNGLPTGNLFEYASFVIKSYEKIWKDRKSKELKNKVEQYWIDKEKQALNSALRNKSLEHRKSYNFIKSLDRSRSSLKIQDNPNKKEVDEETNIKPITTKNKNRSKSKNNKNNNNNKKVNNNNNNNNTNNNTNNKNIKKVNNTNNNKPNNKSNTNNNKPNTNNNKSKSKSKK